MKKKGKFFNLTTDQIRRILYSYPKNVDFFTHDQPEEPHVIKIFGQTKEGKDGKSIPNFMLKANRDNFPDGLRELPNDYLRIMIYPFKENDVITTKDGRKRTVKRSQGSGKPFNIFRSSEPDLYTWVANEIKKENYEIDENAPEEQPQAELNALQYGQIVNTVVPSYQIHNRDPKTGKMEGLKANTRDPESGKWIKIPAIISSRSIFIDDENLKNKEDYVLRDIQRWVAPFFVSEESVTRKLVVGGEVIDEEKEKEPATLTSQNEVEEEKQEKENTKGQKDDDVLDGVEDAV